MAFYIVYGKISCPWTRKALETLQEIGAKYEFIEVSKIGETAFKKLIPRGRKPTVPQIFCDGEYVGGCSELIEEWLPVNM